MLAALASSVPSGNSTASLNSVTRQGRDGVSLRVRLRPPLYPQASELWTLSGRKFSPPITRLTQKTGEGLPLAESQRWCESLRRGCFSLQAWFSRVFLRQGDTDLFRTFRIQPQVCRFVCRTFLDFYDSSSKDQDTSSQTHSYGVFLGVRAPHTHCLPF